MSSSVPLVSRLRSRPEVVRLGTSDEPVITVRVQVPEVWDTVRIDAPPHTPVADLKARALDVLLRDAGREEDYVVKLRGMEVLDESTSLEKADVRNGSTLLVTSRRRRPVR